MSACQDEPFLAAPDGGAGVDQVNHPGGNGAVDDSLAIRLERAMRQVHPDVDELDGHAFSLPSQDTRRELGVHLRVRMRLRGLVPGHE
jgi:hypothetical protein